MRLIVRSVLALILLSYVATAFAAVTVSVNGSNHTIPQSGEKGWGTNVTTWIQAISANTLQPSGGAFTLTADTNFGANFGLVSSYYKSRSSNISGAGVLRLANTDSVAWRNAANDGNLLLALDGDVLEFDGSPLALSADLTAYAPLASPTFTGVVTAPAIVGDLTGNVTGNLTGAVTGNADTATALASNPSDCSANNFATAIAASGNLTCAQPLFTDISGTLSINKGGTGQTTAQAAIDALLPTQTGNSGEFLTTDGTNAIWASPSGSALAVVTKAVGDSPYTVSSSDDYILCNTAGGDVTLTLPAAASNTGKTWYIKKTSASNKCVLDGNSSETIDGDATIDLITNNGMVELFSDGNNLRIRSIKDPWMVDVNIVFTSHLVLGTTSQSAYVTPNASDGTLTARSGSLPVGISCSSTNENTVGSTTCGAGNEEAGIVFNLPRSGRLKCTIQFAHYTSAASATDDIFEIFQLVHTPNNAQTLTEEGGSRIESGHTDSSATQDLSYPATVVGMFNLSSNGKKTVRLMHESSISGTPSANRIESDGNTSAGQRDIRIFCEMN